MSSRIIAKKPYYVTMNDKGMSGWGETEGKTNKYIIGCNTYKQAEEMERLAKDRPEMKYINIVVDRKPYYNKSRFLISYVDYDDIGWGKYD